MAEQLYSIEQHPDTNEWHIFKSTKNEENNSCHLENESICGKMKFMFSAKNKCLCKNAKEIRNQAEKLERSMCGICISNLYKTIK